MIFRDRMLARMLATVAATLIVATTLAATPTPREAALNGAWMLATPAGKLLRTAGGGAPPLNAAGKQLYQQRQALLAKGDTSFDLSAKCKPIGFPRVLWDGGPFDIQLQRDLVFFGYTWNRNHRTAAFSDQPPKLQIPRYYGTSTAKWDGDTLVVQSGLFNDNTLLDSAGLPHSDGLMIAERYRALNGGKQLEVRLTLTDAAYYRAPWEVSVRFQRVPSGRIQEDVCQERSAFYENLLRGK
jgi:hypothetical protein